MKTIKISDDEYHYSFTAEISSDSNIDDIFQAFRALLVGCSFDYELITDYSYKDE